MTRHWTLLATLLILLAGCASTTPAPAAPASEAGRIAEAMRGAGVQIVNLLRVDPPRQRVKTFAESQGFDIPGIPLDGKPAGTIRIFKNEKDAALEARYFKLLGAPGPTTRLDYVTVAGKQELVLDHRLPNEVAQRYITAFTNVASPSS
jgi:hypothetical protein